MNYLLGFDIGSSSIKAAIVEADSGSILAQSRKPLKEMPISAPQSEWAEQDPEDWWKYMVQAAKEIMAKSGIDKSRISAIGISYQMHGLVLVDKDLNVLRPSIIWCDSRATSIGDQIFEKLGKKKCLETLLNSPGNFTASKLKWVKENEPGIYDKIHKILLPGDFIAMKLTGETITTLCGMSEAILWDFKNNAISTELMDHCEFTNDLLPELKPVFSEQGKLIPKAAKELDLNTGIPVTYRAGDQPNNAMSLNVLEPGEFAGNAGTSGVIYGISDRLIFDNQSRINSFAHVNHSQENSRIGLLLCINGTGIQYRWTREQIAESDKTYEKMESLLSDIPVNSNDLRVIPFGNGAERMFNNSIIGSHLLNLNLNIHTRPHLYRAALEGIAYSFTYGIHILHDLGLQIKQLKVGNDNLFQSETFSTTLANLIGVPIKVMEMNGAAGAAKAAGVAMGFYSLNEAFQKQNILKIYEPKDENDAYIEGYEKWKSDLNKFLP